jgi:hypothetical protein
MADETPAPSTEPLRDLLGDLIRRVVRRGQREVEKAAESGRTRLELRQLQSDLDHFYVRLGKTAWHLVEGGEIDHPDLRKAMTRIRELEVRIDAIRSRPAGP